VTKKKKIISIISNVGRAASYTFLCAGKLFQKLLDPDADIIADDFLDKFSFWNHLCCFFETVNVIYDTLALFSDLNNWPLVLVSVTAFLYDYVSENHATANGIGCLVFGLLYYGFYFGLPYFREKWTLSNSLGKTLIFTVGVPDVVDVLEIWRDKDGVRLVHAYTELALRLVITGIYAGATITSISSADFYMS